MDIDDETRELSTAYVFENGEYDLDDDLPAGLQWATCEWCDMLYPAPADLPVDAERLCSKTCFSARYHMDDEDGEASVKTGTDAPTTSRTRSAADIIYMLRSAQGDYPTLHAALRDYSNPDMPPFSAADQEKINTAFSDLTCALTDSQRLDIYDLDRQTYTGAVLGMTTWGDLPQPDDQCAVCFAANESDYVHVVTIVPHFLCLTDAAYDHHENQAPLCRKHRDALGDLPLTVHVLMRIALSYGTNGWLQGQGIAPADLVPAQYHTAKETDAAQNPSEGQTRTVLNKNGGRCAVQVTSECRAVNGWLDQTKIGTLSMTDYGRPGAPYGATRWTKNAPRRGVAGHIFSRFYAQRLNLSPLLSLADSNLVPMCDGCNDRIGKNAPTPREGLRYWFIAAGLL